MKNKNFEKDLKDKLEDLQCRLGFDCLSGEYAGKIFNAMPNRSEVRLFGSLSLNFVSQVIFFDKKQDTPQ